MFGILKKNCRSYFLFDIFLNYVAKKKWKQLNSAGSECDIYKIGSDTILHFPD